MWRFHTRKILGACIAIGIISSAVPLQAAEGFSDDDNSVHEASIDQLAASDITQGCNPPTNDRFCPDHPVTRGQMATFLTRALDLTAKAGKDRFGDDDASIHQDSIRRLAAAGITSGCNPPTNDRFCPDDPVTRGQMATFLGRAFELTEEVGEDFFRDDDGSVHNGAIRSLAAARITSGCNPPANDRYCPDDPVTRGQMATFLIRALHPEERPEQITQKPTQAKVIWRAGMEAGDVSEWYGWTKSATGEWEVVSSPVRSGKKSLALKVFNADGSQQPGPGVRMRVEETDISPSDDSAPENLPDEAYYSVWYYFPEEFEPRSNIFQWKRAAMNGPDHQTRQLLHSVRAQWDEGDGKFKFTLRSKVESATNMADETTQIAESPLRFGTDRWIHFECLYRWSTKPDGRIACWQDGEKIWDVSGIVTEYDEPYKARPRQWTVNNYVGATQPRSHTIFVDDAAVALDRLGP